MVKPTPPFPQIGSMTIRSNHFLPTRCGPHCLRGFPCKGEWVLYEAVKGSPIHFNLVLTKLGLTGLLSSDSFVKGIPFLIGAIKKKKRLERFLFSVGRGTEPQYLVVGNLLIRSKAGMRSEGISHGRKQRP